MEMILIWIAAGALCGWIASTKNRSVGAWVIIGLLTSLIGIVIIALLPKAEPD